MAKNVFVISTGLDALGYGALTQLPVLCLNCSLSMSLSFSLSTFYCRPLLSNIEKSSDKLHDKIY